MPVLGQIWPFLGQKSIFWGDGVKLLVSSYQGTNETPFQCWKHWPVRLKLATRDENVQFWPKKFDIMGQKSIFFNGNRDFCQQGISPVCSGLQLVHSDHPKKNFRFPSNGSFSEAHPCFWPFQACISTLNFEPSSTKLFGTQNDNGPGPGRNYGETEVFTFSQICFFWPKMHFIPKKTPKIC